MRRTLILAAGVLAAGLAAFAAWTHQERATAAAPKRPNIVLIIADDMSWHDSGTYGSKDVPTPNIDRLAREGMQFQRAFQTTAMCAVTRHQLYTGLDPVRNGAYPQHSWARPTTVSIVKHLKDLGYRVGITGKTHVGPPSVFPWELLNGGPRDFGSTDENSEPLDFAALEAFVGRSKAEPFFAVVGSHNPHSPWTEGDYTRFDPAKVTVPAYLADTPATREGLRRYYAEITALDAEVGRVMEILERQGADRDTLVLFTSEQGNSVPFAKWTLYDAGLRTQMIVRWPGRVKPGTRTEAMVSYADVTPTFIAAAGGSPPADLDGKSFLPVLTGARDRHRDHVFGIHTNLGIIGGEPYPIRSVRSDRYKLIVNLASDSDYRNVINNTQAGNRVIKDWVAAGQAGNAWAAARVAAYNRRPPEELYDIVADPNELTNLAGDPKLAGVKAALRAELDGWMSRQGDRGMASEMIAFQFINPAIVQWINRNYPDAARNPDGSKVNP